MLNDDFPSKLLIAKNTFTMTSCARSSALLESFGVMSDVTTISDHTLLITEHELFERA
jgi:hypothetical protein